MPGRRGWLLALVSVATPLALPAQQPAPPDDKTSREKGDIVVVAPSAKRPRSPDPPTSAKVAIAQRIGRDTAGIFVRCARRIAASQLRAIIDGPPNEAGTRTAMGLLRDRYRGCMLPGHIDSTIAASVDRDFYIRGALLDHVLTGMADALALTPTMTADPIVRHRFNLREVPLARWRLKGDREYFETAVCMVRLQPESAVALIRSPPGSAAERRHEQTIIEGSRVCVGNAPVVRVNPTQFRVYIADSLYRWVAAATGRPSLIPDDTST